MVVFKIQGLSILTPSLVFFLWDLVRFVGLLGQGLRLGLDNFLLFILSYINYVDNCLK